MKTTFSFKRCVSCWTIILLAIPNLEAQLCSSGTIYVSGNNCGCWQNCDLTSISGPSCGSGTLGNCEDGHQFMSTRIFVPSGCSVTANIAMANRSGCPHSAADGGPAPCTSCDQIRVYTPGNNAKGFKSGSDNTDIYDSETVLGPDTLIIEAFANRQDEVVSYSVSYSSGVCDGSCVTLPLSLLDLKVITEGTFDILNWVVGQETGLAFYQISNSVDGAHFETLRSVSPQLSGEMTHTYQENISNAVQSRYYRLEAFDLNHQLVFTRIISKSSVSSLSPLFLSYNSSQICIGFKEKYDELHIYDMTGHLLLQDHFIEKESCLPSFITPPFLIHVSSGNKQNQLFVPFGP